MKKIIIMLVSFILACIIGGLIWYNVSLSAPSKEPEEVTFAINNGDKTKEIIENLKEARLIKSKTASSIYLKLHKDIKLRAGEYKLKRNANVQSLMARLNEGGTASNTVKITFKEGFKVADYVEQIAEATDKNKEDLIKEINSKEFLEPLIEEYWFLTDDILKEGIYYPLEGYLYPNTHEIYKTSSLKSIIKKMLNDTNKKLDPYKIDLKESKYSMHEILTMASIIEKEAVKAKDREMVSQVIYKRLNTRMSLGMDVTSYYGVQKSMKEELLQVDLDDDNPYNTRRSGFLGLPIGPICNPSTTSIKAALHPADTDYIYFVADISTGDVYFAKNQSEFAVLKEKYMK